MMPGYKRPVSRMTAPTALLKKLDSGNTSGGFSRSHTHLETRLENEVLGKSTSPTYADERSDVVPGSGLLPLPRHAHIPDIPQESNLLYEAVVFLFALISLGLQYINLYKTVWWLPHSHINYALNFYLIDPYLVIVLVVIMSRRLLWCFVKEVYGGSTGTGCWYWLVQVFKLTVMVQLSGLLAWTGYNVLLRNTLIYTLFLCYPLVMYMILFGFNVRALFSRLLPPPATTQLPKSPEKAGTPKRERSQRDLMSPRDSLSRENSASRFIHDLCREPILHACSTSSESVRDEVDCLKTDFNVRIKQVLFNSMLCAYYMGFIPICFAQNTLYYDTWWVGQHVVLVWISSFLMFMVHFLPPKYIDTLHRSALHLGCWGKVEGRHAHVPYNAWSELQIWPHGALVKHVRGLFKAEGVNNSAEPGNSMHYRFYLLFHRPLRVTNWLLGLTWALIIYEFLLLLQATEWSHIIALAFLLFCNYYMLFKLTRDRMVLSRAYKDETTTNTT